MIVKEYDKEMEKELLELIKSNVSEDEIVDLIGELVKRPSHEGIVNNETEVAKYIEGIFKREGIKSELVHVIDGRHNLIAKVKGEGEGETILLTGHMDTVPPYDMEDPYDMKIEDGMLKGRGVLDMKGPLACMIYSLIAIKRSGIKLKGDVVFAGVIDEEEKSYGTIDLIESGVRADAAIIGEPTHLDICIAHRGLEWVYFDFPGIAVHGGEKEKGINSILNASNFIQKLEEELEPKLEEQTHQLIGKTTMTYGTINGGTQPSTVAGDCTLGIGIRWVPGIHYEEVMYNFREIITEMEEEDKDFKCNMSVLDMDYGENTYIHPAMETDMQNPVVYILKNSISRVDEDKGDITFFPGWTDGGLLNKYADIPSVVFGPGELHTAHSDEEEIPIDSIMPATLIYSLTAIDFCKIVE